MATVTSTVVESSGSYLTFLRLLGICPFRLDRPRVCADGERQTGKLASLDPTKGISGAAGLFKEKGHDPASPGHQPQSAPVVVAHEGDKYAWCNHVIISGSTFLAVLGLAKFFMMDFQSVRTTFVLGMVCSLLTSIPSLFVMLGINRKRKDICTFLNEWSTLESWFLNDGGNRGKVMSAELNTYRRWLLGYCASGCISITVTLAMNQYILPDHPAYLSSLVPEALRNSSIHEWLKLVSQLFHVIAINYVWIALTLFDVLAILFSQSVRRCLQLISCPEGNPEGDSKENLGHRFQCSLDAYGRLKTLVHKFNQLFSGMVLGYKGACLINICLLIYSPLKGYFAFQVKNLAILVFGVAGFFVVTNLAWLLVSLGSVDTQSTAFRQYWIGVLPQLLAQAEGYGYRCGCGCGSACSELPLRTTQAYKEKLLHQENIRFFAGRFYGITSSTLLTFISIATTYLIVLLQL